MTAPTTNISANEFLSLKNSGGKILIIDVRTFAETQNEYLKGSEFIPLQDINTSSFKDLLDKNNCELGAPVYFLCGTGIRAKKATELLESTTQQQLVVIKGGISEIKNAGVVLEQGESSVISLERQVRIAAGSLVVTGVALGTFIHPGYYGLSAFVGAGLVFAGITDTCAMGMALAKLPWNTRPTNAR